MDHYLNKLGRTFVVTTSITLMWLGLIQTSYAAAASQKLIPIIAILLLGGEPLTIESHIPLSDATNVSRGIQIQIVFNSKLDQTTLDAASVTLTQSNGTPPRTLTVQDKTLFITPDVPLELNTLYTVTLQATIKNLSGSPLKEVYSWQFTTTPNNSAPTASGLQIIDNNGNNPEIGDHLTGIYTYSDIDGDSEGTSQLQWFRNGSPIAGSSNALIYTLVPADNGVQIRFQVQPVASSGATPGAAVQSAALQVSTLPAPIAIADTASTLEDTPTNFSAVANDTDADNNIDPASIDLNMSLAGTQSAFTDSNGNDWSANASGFINFTPALNINGDQITPYTISDTDGLVSAAANLTVTVNPVNDPPVAVADSASTDENTAVQFNITNNDSDVDANLDISSVDLNTGLAGIQTSFLDASSNSWNVNLSGLVTFTPAISYYGTATISYTISDSSGAVSALADISVTILEPTALTQTVYRSCAHALQEGQTTSGIYKLSADGIIPPHSIYCDQSNDGGGWTLVGSTKDTTLNDESSSYYTDLTRLAPNSAHTGIWNGLRSLGDRWDVRFTCRAAVGAAANPMDVDLSFYDINWYSEFTTGSDADSCFSEANGQGADSPVPARRNNLNQSFRRKTDLYNGGYLEGEDSCGDTGDFTVDFDDRGLDSEQSDGTDWGEDDASRKCGINGIASGQWFVYTRERPRVGVLGPDSNTVNTIKNAGILAERLIYNSGTADKITTEQFDTIVIGRYASESILTQDIREALSIFGRNGGNIVTEWDGASIFMNQYAADYRYSATAPTPLEWFDAKIGGGDTRGDDTPIAQTMPADPIFENVPDPIQAGSATSFFFSLTDLNPPNQLLGHEVLATFPGGTTAYPAASYPAITRGRYCGGQFISANFDWQDAPDAPGFGSLIANMVRNASTPSPADLNEACPVQQRPQYGVCGNTSADPAEFGLTGIRIDSCVPSNNMQAMLITRSGTIPNASQLRNYVSSGGIVISEYDNAHTVYNAVFNLSVTQADRFGDCTDNIMPSVQTTPQDGFWQENLFEPPAPGQEGCGFDMAAFSGITKLGGWTATTTQLAYRDHGLGRVWLVASDWQDGAPSSAQSFGLMRYMVTHSAGGLYGRGGLQGGVVQNKDMGQYLEQNFTPCLVTPYDSTVNIADIKQACTGNTLILACRAIGSESLQVSAMGARVEVFEDVGNGANAINTHNAINWYFSPSSSWGYAPVGQAVSRASCDTLNASGDNRLCWHTNNDQVKFGWRCGNNTGIGAGWERIILQRDGDVPSP